MITRQKEYQKIVEATCDKCGNDCMIPQFEKTDGDRDDVDIPKEFVGMILRADWGYKSDKDGERWEAVYCEECVDKHLSDVPFQKTFLF